MKSLTVILSFGSCLFLFFLIKNKAKIAKNDGHIHVKNLTQHFFDTKALMVQNIHSKKEFKFLMRNFKNKVKILKKDATKKSQTFVVKFTGDIKANSVNNLREEVTAILLIATQEDEMILILESPGGTVNGYGLAASELDRIRQKNINLTVIVDKVAASGGYMMASIANKIIAAPFSIIGSIGVISQMPNFNKALKDRGVDFEQITSGKYKRTLTMFGENTDEDRQKYQQELDEIHHMFKLLIKTKRKNIDIEKVSTGEYWLGTKAKELGLVDELMTSDDYLMKLFELDKKVFLIEYKTEQTLMSKLSGVCGDIKSFIKGKYI